MMGSLAVLEMRRISNVSSRICSTMPVLLSLLRGICACHCRLHAVPFGLAAGHPPYGGGCKKNILSTCRCRPVVLLDVQTRRLQQQHQQSS